VDGLAGRYHVRGSHSWLGCGLQDLEATVSKVVELEMPVWSMVGEDGHEDGWTWVKLKKLTLGGGTDGDDRRGYAPEDFVIDAFKNAAWTAVEELTLRGVVNSGAPGGFYNAYIALLKRFPNLRRLEAVHVIASDLWKDGGRVNVSEHLEKDTTTKSVLETACRTMI
jgi:hypothetical protein